ncbi:hypothetical protein NW759_008979 [Fusarium solani]|nr:hypothetical protein NW759_008979 [Fusarium solani]
MALSKLFSFLALNGLAFSAIISTPAPSDAFVATTTQMGLVRKTITLASGLVGVVDGTVLALANTTLTPAPTAHTVGHHTISLGSDRVVVVDGETTTLPSPGDVGGSSFQPSTIVESSETDLSAPTGSSDTPQDTATTTTGSAQSGSTDLPATLDTTSGSGSLTTSNGPGSDSTTEPTSTATGHSSDSTSESDSGSTGERNPISDGQDVTQSVPQTTSETTTVNPITGTMTEPPMGFSTELITNSDLTTNTWITTTKDDQETVVPVLVGCPGCGGTFGGIILWGLPSVTNVVFNLPSLPPFYLPCIHVLGASIGQCTQGPSDPPEDSKSDPSSCLDDETKTRERETSASSSRCDATDTATDVFVACGTGSADGSATTTCSTSTTIVTGCSVSGSTTTSITGGVCLLRPTPDARGPIGTYSFQGHVPFSLPDIAGTVSEMESSTGSSTGSTVESSTVLTHQPPTSTSFSTLISTTSSTTLPPRVPAPAITMTTTDTSS